MDVGAPRTNLIIHQRIADILDQATKPAHILGAVQESRDPPLFFKRDEVLENLIQFPSNPYTSDRLLTLESWVTL
jgi:hypothetical protein